MSATKRDIFAPDLLSDKRILITGGGTGLGRGVAARLVKYGAEVHLWGRREAALAEAAAQRGAHAVTLSMAVNASSARAAASPTPAPASSPRVTIVETPDSNAALNARMASELTP